MKSAEPLGELEFFGATMPSVHDHAAQDRVVLAGVDLDLRVLDGVDDLLLLLGGQLRGQALRALDAELAGLLERLVDVVEQLVDVDAAGDLDRVVVADLLLTLVLGVREPRARVEAERGERLVLGVALLLGLLVAGLELLEDLVGDGVLVALEGDEGLVARRGHPRLDALAVLRRLRIDTTYRRLAP